MQKNKVLVIVGQTATGKSSLAVRLAKKLHGEIISADSRQVYKGLDLGSGKITEKEMKGVPHHLLNIVDPKKKFSVAEYKKLAERKIKEILARGKTPIICGGTGFYIDAITKGVILPEVPPNKKLREELFKKETMELALELKKLDPERTKTIDIKNKVRLVRAIEIAQKLGRVPALTAKEPEYMFIKIGLKVPEKTLKRKIKLRLHQRLRAGMAIEIYDLQKRGVPWERFMELGFDQRHTALYLQGKINEKEMLQKLFAENWRYAKRQMTWFKRDPEIKWWNPKDYSGILTYCKKVI